MIESQSCVIVGSAALAFVIKNFIFFATFDRAGGAGAVDFAGWMRAVMRTVMRVDDEMLGKKIRKRNGYVQGI